MHNTKQTQKYFPPEKVEFLRNFVSDYMAEKKLSPQQMYDLIMEPEIEETISQAWTEKGVRLSRVQARPHPGNEGRDIIRNWVQRYPFSVHQSFLSKADRFLRQTGPNKNPLPSTHQAQLERRAKLAALRELLGGRQSVTVQDAGLRIDHTYGFALVDLSGEDRVLGCMTVRFDDLTTGSFHIFRFNAQLYDRTWEFNLKNGKCRSRQFTTEQIELVAHGLCSVRTGGIYRDGSYGKIELDALYSDVIETSTISTSEFWFPQSGMNAALGRFHFDYRLKQRTDRNPGYGRDGISVYAGVFYKDQKDQYGDRLRLQNFPISTKQMQFLEELSGYRQSA